MEGAATKVCVTGAGGFLASWLVKLLLSNRYFVHGTVRDPGNQKNAHLLKFKADPLDYESLSSAISGCREVFHVASPVPSTTVSNPEAEMIEPSVTGTTNVLKASLEAKVERVVFVSSIVAVTVNPNLPKDEVIDESCWSDKEYCRRTKPVLSDFARNTGLSVVTICPTAVWGPILQKSTVNASSLILLKLFQGVESLENKQRWIVDVCDVADAILMAYEKPEADGRYICTAHSIMTDELVEKLRRICPNYSYPKNFVEVNDCIKLSSEKLQRLGWKYRPLEETLVVSVESYKAAGHLESK